MAENRLARRLLAWLPLAVVVALGAVFLTILEPEPGARLTESPTSAPRSTSAPTSTTAPGTTSRPTAPVAVDDIGEPILGVEAGWELFLRGGGQLVRVELAQGRITRTELPAVSGSGPVSFVLGPEQAIIRPLDHGNGYVVPDGEPARTLPRELNRGTPMFPGPGATVWVVDSERSMAVQRRFDGTATGRTVRLPVMSWPLDSDGRGTLVIESVGGAYLAKPAGPRRITTGELLAMGPTRFLVLECDEQARCSTVVVDRAEGTRRVLARNTSDRYGLTGVISPDGATAAVPLTRSGAGLRLVDLSSDASDPLDVITSSGPRGLRDRLAWSPDSEWLFAVGDSGLRAVSADSHEVRTLDLGLSVVNQIAVRPESP